MMKPCLKCGELSQDSYCADHAFNRTGLVDRKSDANRLRQAGIYNSAWDRLSSRARKLQDYCLHCGTRDDLTADHLPSAHWKIHKGEPVTLYDIQILCRRCNSAAGPAHIGSARFTAWAESVGLHNYAEPGDVRSSEGDRLPPGLAPERVTLTGDINMQDRHIGMQDRL